MDVRYYIYMWPSKNTNNNKHIAKVFFFKRHQGLAA